ncbi:PREDICTED: SHC-transforming protein 1-like [Condylura cristata]|uniref:SHC-transforming protein 1-like n=1 Tax=Condylura cristata TaxID=143302 RepID=UPI000643CEF0|nr:PREDICTED: SHC-transforming protein 1-like [Condylura cristata]
MCTPRLRRRDLETQNLRTQKRQQGQGAARQQDKKGDSVLPQAGGATTLRCETSDAASGAAVPQLVPARSILFKQPLIIANHHMQSISFASGGDTDMTDYVAYVAKDPINQRACHILECCGGLAQSVISTVGQAFELRFKQYLHSPPKVVGPLGRYRLPPPTLPGPGLAGAWPFSLWSGHGGGEPLWAHSEGGPASCQQPYPWTPESESPVTPWPPTADLWMFLCGFQIWKPFSTPSHCHGSYL